MKRSLVAGLALVLIAGSAMAAPMGMSVDVATYGDGLIEERNPDTNFDGETQACVTGRDRARAMIIGFDLSSYAGETVLGDGTFTIYQGWLQDPNLPTVVYELTGGAFDEATVTFNNYVGVGAADCTPVLGASLAVISGDSAWGEVSVAIPQATLQAMVDGTVSGLAMSSAPESYINNCWRCREWGDAPVAADDPTLHFDVTPEPTSLILLGLGGLAALRRRR